MAYRYNLIVFADQGEYWNFIESVVEDDLQCYLTGHRCVFGKEIKNSVSSGTFTGRQVLTRDYTGNILLMHSGFEGAAAEINRIVTRVFWGDLFSWPGDTLPAIEMLQQVTGRYGSHLPDLENFLSLLKNALQHMQGNDVYAFCDTMILMERYLQKHMDFIRLDIQCMREFGCFENA